VKSGICAIAHEFGEIRCDNEEIARRHGFDLAFIQGKLGIDVRYAASDKQAASDLAVGAARKALDKAGLKPSDIGLIAVVTQTPDHQIPHTAALVQHALGLPAQTAAFDISLGCSGFVYGLSVATAFMEANGIERGLLVTTDVYSKIIDPTDRATAPLFSDASAATVLGREGRYFPGRASFGSDGSGADKLIVACGGSRKPEGKKSLSMDGREIFNFMMTRVPDDVKKCLAENSKRLDEVDRFVFHQASLFMLDSLRQRLNIPKERMVYALRKCGNTVASSIPIALEGIMDEGHKTILISGFGVGLSWASNLLFRNG
jgi:3-oxoacyl-[acyl-carrier-protein] synthase-3